ncbi:hypothetical protein LTR84_000863 [Exophiala bonariae]|uniref:Zn(2)-C6 fungal-type domain-containing protein n=1 Tax=Exophiala bonariae TaxID=1690606 RepID=A0AAV9NVW1_9EURO|nr:hypothetical protein LTR84_000863 [Exophiala bonariae]
MDSFSSTVKGNRVKACTECRQQKLKCDAKELTSLPCSRCSRQKLHCEISQTYRRVKRRRCALPQAGMIFVNQILPRKSELQAELQALREQLHQSTNQATLPGGSKLQHSFDESDSSLSSADLDRFMTLPRNSQNSRSIDQDYGVGSFSSMNNSSWTIGDLAVGQAEVQDCFHAFLRNYLVYQPVVDSDLKPRECYEKSVLLFWTVVAIGSRRYVKDPTLVISLAPKLTELVEKNILSTETDGVLFTIQALLLLCAWPIPFDSLSHDCSSTIAGAVLGLAMSNGLHVLGVGQDFARKKLVDDHKSRRLRAKLWSICIATCQRVSTIKGTPPIWIPDTYDRPLSRNSYDSLPVSVRFQKVLGQRHTEALFSIETQALPLPTDARDARIVTTIEEWLISASTLEHECPTSIGKLFSDSKAAYKLRTPDKFTLQAATLQMLQFYLFLSLQHIDITKIQRIFAASCDLAELVVSLEQSQQFCDYAPLPLIQYLHLAAVLILRTERSSARENLDVARGKSCYFAIIQMHKKIPVRSDDFWARGSVYLPQMWASKKAYRKPDGTRDSLTLRCRNRLGMSIVYDSYWWWRQEFTNEPYPYDIENSVTTTPTANLTGTPETDVASFGDVEWLQFPMTDFPLHFPEVPVPDDWSTMPQTLSGNPSTMDQLGQPD